MALVREMYIEGAIVRIWDDYCAQSDVEKRAIKRTQQQVARDILARALKRNETPVKREYDLPEVKVLYDRDRPIAGD